MTYYLASCFGIVAPYYNLILVVIVIIQFMKLFSLKSKKAYLKPWKIFFAAILIYVVEEIFVILESLNIVNISNLIFPFLEMIIITLFIYMLLLQRNYVETTGK